jgi:tetratricopeptide (TPR) repeat protein
VLRAGLAAALAEAGRADQAQAEVERLAAGDLAALPRDPMWSWSLATLALACHDIGDTERGARVRELLEPYADRMLATASMGALCLGPAAYFLGLLDLALDQPEQALRRFERAATLAAKIEARPMIAMSQEGRPGRFWPWTGRGIASRPRRCSARSSPLPRRSASTGSANGPALCWGSWPRRRRRPGRRG